MSSIDPKWLEDFLALARERSFSKAATERHVTQPQFSRRIRALELWLGADVVNRAGAPLTLTTAGEQLLPVARNATAQLQEVRERVQSTRMDADWVVVATGRTLARTWVPAWSQRLRAALGAPVRMRLVTGAINDAVVALEQGHADFMLSYSHPRLQLSLDSNQFESVTMAHESLLAVSAPRAPAKPMHNLPGSARKPTPVLRYASTLALGHILQDALSRDPRERHCEPVLESDFAESLHEQALLGAGVAWLPRSLVQVDLDSGRLVAADPGAPAIGFEVQLHRPRLARNVMIQRVWDTTVQRL